MLLKGFEFPHSTLQTEIGFTDFTHVRSLFRGHSDNILSRKVPLNKEIQ